MRLIPRCRWLRTRLARLLSPICQDFGATLYVSYRGTRVSMVPVVDKYDHALIIDWIPSPSQRDAVDARLAGSGDDAPDDTGTPVSYEEPVRAAQPPPLPPVNPASIPGL